MKKIGYFFLAMLPALLMLIISAITAIIGGVVMVLFDELSADVISETDSLMIIQIVAMSITFMLGLIVLKLGMRDKTLGNPLKAFPHYTLIGTILITFGMMVVVDAVIVLIALVAPESIDAYSSLIEESGLADLTVLSTIAAAICAPLNEETIFRGITLRILHAGGYSFMAANIIQALFFGILHMNIVQGLYAFVLGLMLGYIYKKSGSLWASITAHMLFNILGTFGSRLLEQYLNKPAFALGFIGASLCSLLLGVYFMKLRRR